jgi:hypothetical protein
MHDLYRLKENIVKELEDYGKQGLSKSNLDVIDKLAHAGKNVAKIIECCEGEEYSMGRNYSMRDSYRGSYRDGRSYADESYVRPDGSYARGRGSGARRDSMGRYSSEGNEAAYDVRMLLNRTHDEQTRQELSKLLDKLESM